MTDPGMTSYLRQRTETTRCRMVATVNTAALQTLPASSEVTHPQSGHLSCELMTGHDGSHVALVGTAHDGDQWWWLRWDGQPGEAIEVVQMDSCDAKLPHGRYADDCFLPADHPGLHTFDLQPMPVLPEPRHPVRLRP